MVRWEPNARGRLQQAAMELYVDRGYEQTTVAEIATRAGLTERTFFRHFADKREVLFAGSELLHELFVNAVAGAPASATPLDAVAAALDAVGTMFRGRRDGSRLRHGIIVANAELQERELIKLATLASAIAGALRERGVADPAASLAGEAGIAVFRIAFDSWMGDADGRELSHHLRESLAELKAITAGS